MVTAWFVKGDLSDKGKPVGFNSVVFTKAANQLPDVSSLPLGNDNELLLIREVKLLVEFDQEKLDFVCNQA